MSNGFKEQLEHLLTVQDKADTLELENKALRFQNEEQTRLISKLQEDLHLMGRFRALIERASKMAEDLPRLKEELLDRKKAV